MTVYCDGKTFHLRLCGLGTLNLMEKRQMYGIKEEYISLIFHVVSVYREAELDTKIPC